MPTYYGLGSKQREKQDKINRRYLGPLPLMNKFIYERKSTDLYPEWSIKSLRHFMLYVTRVTNGIGWDVFLLTLLRDKKMKVSKRNIEILNKLMNRVINKESINYKSSEYRDIHHLLFDDSEYILERMKELRL